MTITAWCSTFLPMSACAIIPVTKAASWCEILPLRECVMPHRFVPRSVYKPSFTTIHHSRYSIILFDAGNLYFYKMSSRQLRKLQQQRELEQAKLREQAGAESEEQEEDTAPVQNKASLFANFAALQDEEGDSNENDNPVEDEQESEEEIVPVKKNKKPKRKKNKGKNKAQIKAEPTVADVEDSDDIDAALKELNIKAAKNNSAVNESVPQLDPEYERICALLGVNSQHLKVANEMRNLFGRTATENHDDAGGHVGRGARRNHRAQQLDLETALKGHHAPGKGLPDLTMRRNVFIQGKDDWPRASTGGLTMEIVDDKAPDGTVEFRFVHDQAYETIQQQFAAYVEMGDPQNLIGLLQKNRMYLFQLSDRIINQWKHIISLFSSKSVKLQKIRVTTPCHRI
jgi:hypothetical protein